jgi:hypothetical protein
MSLNSLSINNNKMMTQAKLIVVQYKMQVAKCILKNVNSKLVSAIVLVN